MSSGGIHTHSGFRRWCNMAAIFAGMAALSWFWKRDGSLVVMHLSWALLLLPGFLWDSRQSRPLRYFYNTLIILLAGGAAYVWGRVLGWIR